MFCYPKSSNVETAKNLGIALTVLSLITCLGGNLQTNEGTVYRLVFRSSHFLFLVFGHFCQQSYGNTKTFVYILQSKMGKMEKKLERKSRN